MRAVVFTENGPSDVLSVIERPVPEPGPGQVRVRVFRSGVNPTDWKSRVGLTAAAPDTARVPGQDGAGVVDAVGAGVDPQRVGERVWVYLAATAGAGSGTAQEYTVLPQEQAVPLPPAASLDLGAALGVPGLTAHRCLTVREAGPHRLGPGALAGRTVLVSGGAGAVGNAAIQLARWCGAQVITTVSSPAKAELARAAGAQHVLDYRSTAAAELVAAVRRIAPDGVQHVVEVAAAANASLVTATLADGASVGVYADDDGAPLSLDVRAGMVRNARWQFVLLYGVPRAALLAGVQDLSLAVAQGAFQVGESAGLPQHHYPLERLGQAQDAVQSGVVGKVLVDVVRA